MNSFLEGGGGGGGEQGALWTSVKMVIKIYKLKKSITLKTLKERNDIKHRKKAIFSLC